VNENIGICGISYWQTYSGPPTPKEHDISPFFEIIPQLREPSKRMRGIELMIMAARRSLSPSMVPQILDSYFKFWEPLDDEPTHSGLLNLHPSIWNDPRIVALADFDGRRSKGLSNAHDTDSVIAAFNANPSKRGLLAVIALEPHRKRRTTNYQQLNGSAFIAEVNDEPAVRASVALLRLFTGKWTGSDIDALAHDLGSPGSYRFIGRALSEARTKLAPEYGGDTKRLVQALAFEQLNWRGYVSRLTFETLNTEVGGGPTNLGDVDQAKMLCLPTTEMQT
jgi:hypothetical protein